MKKILYILTILVFGTTYSQENKTSDCNLQKENKVWKVKFEKAESKTERIELIKAKIKAEYEGETFTLIDGFEFDNKKNEGNTALKGF